MPQYAITTTFTMTAPAVIPESPIDMLGAKVIYWQSKLCGVKAVGIIVGIREACGVLWIRIWPVEPSRFVAKEHEASDIVGYVWPEPTPAPPKPCERCNGRGVIEGRMQFSYTAGYCSNASYPCPDCCTIEDNETIEF